MEVLPDEPEALKIWLFNFPFRLLVFLVAWLIRYLKKKVKFGILF